MVNIHLKTVLKKDVLPIFGATGYSEQIKEYQKGILQYPKILFDSMVEDGSILPKAANELIEAHQKDFILGNTPRQQFGIFLISLVKHLVNGLWTAVCLHTFIKKNIDLKTLPAAPAINTSISELRTLLKSGTGNTNELQSQIGQFLLTGDNWQNYAVCFDLFDDLMFPFKGDKDFAFLAEYQCRTVIRLPPRDGKVENKLNYLGIHDLGKINRLEVPLRVIVYDFKLDAGQPDGKGFKTWTIVSSSAKCVSLSVKSSTTIELSSLTTKLEATYGKGAQSGCYLYLDSRLEEKPNKDLGVAQYGYKVVDKDEKINKVIWPEHTNQIVLFRIEGIRPPKKGQTLFVKERLGYPHRIAVYCKESKAGDPKAPLPDLEFIGDGTPGKPDITKSALYASLFGNPDRTGYNLSLAGISRKVASAERFLAANPHNEGEDGPLVDLLNGLRVLVPDLQTVALQTDPSEADFEETEELLSHPQTQIDIEPASAFGILQDEYQGEPSLTVRYIEAKKGSADVQADELVGHFMILLDTSDIPERLSNRNIWDKTGTAPNKPFKETNKIANYRYKDIDAAGKLVATEETAGKEPNRRVHVVKNAYV